MDRDIFDKFYNKALRFLSFRPRSEKEVRDNLKKAKVPDSTIQAISVKLKEKNFLNDEEFAKWWIEQRTAFKPRSLRLIKMELRQKGIAQDLIKKMIYESGITNKDDLESAEKLIEKRLSRYKNSSKEEKIQKLGRFLASKGFDYDVIKKVFSRMKLTY